MSFAGLLILGSAVGAPIVAVGFACAWRITANDNTDLHAANKHLRNNNTRLIETNEQLHRSLRNDQAALGMLQDWIYADIERLLKEGEQR